ncbi:MAG: hypothetical protein LBV23_08910 [Deltaproteobacteria bacterium]|jgi:hypothetical protein|nr:hypothetical protein [Deltaproteobacteria bacterium]
MLGICRLHKRDLHTDAGNLRAANHDYRLKSWPNALDQNAALNILLKGASPKTITKLIGGKEVPLAIGPTLNKEITVEFEFYDFKLNKPIKLAFDSQLFETLTNKVREWAAKVFKDGFIGLTNHLDEQKLHFHVFITDEAWRLAPEMISSSQSLEEKLISNQRFQKTIKDLLWDNLSLFFTPLGFIRNKPERPKNDDIVSPRHKYYSLATRALIVPGPQENLYPRPTIEERSSFSGSDRFLRKEALQAKVKQRLKPFAERLTLAFENRRNTSLRLKTAIRDINCFKNEHCFDCQFEPPKIWDEKPPNIELLPVEKRILKQIPSPIEFLISRFGASPVQLFGPNGHPAAETVDNNVYIGFKNKDRTLWWQDQKTSLGGRGLISLTRHYFDLPQDEPMATQEVLSNFLSPVELEAVVKRERDLALPNLWLPKPCLNQKEKIFRGFIHRSLLPAFLVNSMVSHGFIYVDALNRVIFPVDKQRFWSYSSGELISWPKKENSVMIWLGQDQSVFTASDPLSALTLKLFFPSSTIVVIKANEPRDNNEDLATRLKQLVQFLEPKVIVSTNSDENNFCPFLGQKVVKRVSLRTKDGGNFFVNYQIALKKRLPGRAPVPRLDNPSHCQKLELTLDALFNSICSLERGTLRSTTDISKKTTGLTKAYKEDERCLKSK